MAKKCPCETPGKYEKSLKLRRLGEAKVPVGAKVKVDIKAKKRRK